MPTADCRPARATLAGPAFEAWRVENRELTTTRSLLRRREPGLATRAGSCQGDLGDGVVPGLCDPDGLLRAGGDAVEVAVR